MVKIGKIELGEGRPIVVQSMTNTFTSDVEASVEQVKRMVEAGCEMVRLTVPSMKEAESLREIKRRLRSEGIETPLIADVHFLPEVAEACAAFVEKVRVNPGNFTDKRSFKQLDLTDSEYASAVEAMAKRAQPLFNICKEHGTALRIGINHGSLSDRIVSRYGNTPYAMAQSAMEWVDICERQNFHNVVFSMKSSNVNVMTEATMLLLKQMREAGTVYPLHLGVTEAGAGDEGRVKSAAGIGALLLNGIGNTIRVSLTEPPENEVPFAKLLTRLDEEKNRVTSERNENRLILSYDTDDRQKWMAVTAAYAGYEHFRNKLNDIEIHNHFFNEAECQHLADLILQACRIKMTHTEIISCPSCGRTQYDIQGALAKVKARFSNYPNLKIGVMGCIVNGPGEMADADYGIVGASRGKVAVYRQKERLTQPMEVDEALDYLEKLITSPRGTHPNRGRWRQCPFSGR